MKNIPRFALVLFKLPDGKVVLQRRTKDAPYAPGLLGVFGGGIEESETVEAALVREIKEETSLDTDKLNLVFVTDFVIPASEYFDKDRQFYLYETTVENADFEVYEGDGAEVFSVSDLIGRKDLITNTVYILEHGYMKV